MPRGMFRQWVQNSPFSRSSRRRWFSAAGPLLAWLLLVGAAHWLARHNGLTAGEGVQALVGYLGMHSLGPLLFLAVAACCPLVLFPAALLGIAAGAIFGPVWGVVYTLLACNVSASVAYTLGYAFGKNLRSESSAGRLGGRYGAWLHRNCFSGIIALRLMFLPYDPVNYLAGALHLGWRRFIFANTLGCLPGALGLVLVGDSLQTVVAGMGGVNPWLIATAGLVIVLGLATALVLRRRCA